MPDPIASRRVRILREDVSRKIAAGEVIDRPLSVVRELLDNALDAGARNVDVYLEGGGLARIRVVDDGEGMSREDLELCTERHATSKIVHEEDLTRVSTLGFRGEALASIAACARLTLTSRQADASEGWRLVVEGGARRALEPCPTVRGSNADAAELFFNLPARRKFMKSVSSEAQGCRQSFLDKSLPHPQTGFRFFADGALKVFLPPQELKERVAAAYALDPVHLLTGEGESAGARIRTVAGRPELVRQDRKLIQVFVNRRRVSDFSLVQAVEYAYGEHVPGGAFPIAFVFLEVDPAQVDFNIHPAKKEVRFRNLGELRQLLIGALRGPLASFNLSAGVQRKQPPAVPGSTPLTFDLGQPPGAAVTHRAQAAPAGEPSFRGAPQGREVTYHGQVFRLFLLAEMGDSLFLIDQHAAHERLLFEELLARPLAPQELLLPVPLAGIQESLVQSRREDWGRLGIRVERDEGGGYAVSALPEELLCLEEELAEALAAGSGSPEELRHRILSLAACRTAVKDGEEMDPLAASELVRRALSLDNARCPHGRPLWMEVRRSDLWKTVGRP